MRVLILGGRGQLAQAFVRHLTDHKLWAPGREELDLCEPESLARAFVSFRPEVVINAAAYNLVDQAEKDFEAALRVNAWGPGHLARLCQEHGVFLLHFSTDYVFDGTKKAPYHEDDPPWPLNRYGLSKWLGEIAVREHLSTYLLFRVSWLYGPGSRNFLARLEKWCEQQSILRLAYDEFSVPTYVDTVARVAWQAFEQGLTGLFHLVSRGFASRLEWAKAYLELRGLEREIVPVPAASFSLPAKRPFFSVLCPEKIERALGIRMPYWHEDLARFLARGGLCG